MADTPMDYSKFSTDDLIALKNKDYSKVSTEGLMLLKGQPTTKPQAKSEPQEPSYMSKVYETFTAPLEVATSLAAAPIVSGVGNVIGAGSTLFNGTYGTPQGATAAEKRSAEFAEKYTPQPRTDLGKRMLGGIGNIIEKSGIQGIPMTEFPAISAATKPLTEMVGVKTPKVNITPPAKPGEIVNPRAKELRALEKEHGVDLTYGQESGKVPAQRLEAGMRHIPFFGTGSKFEKLQIQTQQAANNFVKKFQSGEDYGADIHDSLRRGLATAKTEAGLLYDDVAVQIQKNGVVNEVKSDNLKPVIQQLMKESPDIFKRLPDQALETKIGAIGSALEQKEPVSTIVNVGGRPMTLTPEQAKKYGIATPEQPVLTFQEARALREKLNDYIQKAGNSSNVIGSKELHKLIEVKTALDKDIDAFGEQVGNKAVHDAYRKANTFYSENVGPFSDKLISKATMKDVDTDTILKMFVKEDRPKLAEKLYERLDNPGKLAIKFGILKEAFDRSFDSRTNNFLSGKFSDELHKLSGPNEVLFTAEEKTQVDGLAKLMKVSEEAGFNQKISTKTESLTKAEPIGMAALMITHPIATAKFGITAKMMTWLLTSEKGKSLLTEVAKTPESSARFKELQRQATLLSAGLAARQQQPQQQQ